MALFQYNSKETKIICKGEKYMIGNILLGIVSVCTLISYLPQTIKLIITKKSNDLSVSAWILWVISSLSYTLYAIICSKESMLIFQTSLELFFCLSILLLAIKYKDNKWKLYITSFKDFRKNIK